jgi:hypothetical protein
MWLPHHGFVFEQESIFCIVAIPEDADPSLDKTERFPISGPTCILLMASNDGETGSRPRRVVSYVRSTPAVNLRVTVRLSV